MILFLTGFWKIKLSFTTLLMYVWEFWSNYFSNRTKKIVNKNMQHIPSHNICLKWPLTFTNTFTSKDTKANKKDKHGNTNIQTTFTNWIYARTYSFRVSRCIYEETRQVITKHWNDKMMIYLHLVQLPYSKFCGDPNDFFCYQIQSELKEWTRRLI